MPLHRVRRARAEYGRAEYELATAAIAAADSERLTWTQVTNAAGGTPAGDHLLIDLTDRYYQVRPEWFAEPGWGE